MSFAEDAIMALTDAITAFRKEWLEDDLRDVLDETLEVHGIRIKW